MLQNLRDEKQQEFIERVREALRQGYRRPMLQAPTGYGKTRVASAITSNAIQKDKRVIFTVPGISLIDQTVEMFWKQNIRDVGVIQAQHEMTNWSRPVQICSIHTLRKYTPPDADIVMIDEAHRWFDFYGKWMMDEKWAKTPFMGLSATPWTKGLGAYYDKLIIAATTQEMIEQGFLSPFRVFAPSHPDLTGVRTVAGDYSEGDLSKAVNKNDLVANIVETWLKHARGRRTFVFAVDRAHAKNIQQQFQAAGVKTDYVDAFTNRQEREAIRNRFHFGDTEVVCNVECLTTGVDWDVRCIVLARPTKSEILFTQMIGRGLRTAEGKDECLILDHSDTHLRLGFVTDIHHETLDTGKERTARQKAEKVTLPKECPQCHFLKPPRTAACPSCGFVCTAHSHVKTSEGELTEFKGKKKGAATAVEKLKFYSELLWYAQHRGIRSGWVAHKYREKFGVWPKNVYSAIPAEPSPETLSWIKSRNIAYAKGRQNRWGASHASA